MRTRNLILAGTAIFMAACQSASGTGRELRDAAGSCDPAAARSLEGRPKISDREAKRITGAKLVRQGKPGDPMTMDLRPDRVTVINSPSTGRIVQASCV